jgi:hypothetical protein
MCVDSNERKHENATRGAIFKYRLNRT